MRHTKTVISVLSTLVLLAGAGTWFIARSGDVAQTQTGKDLMFADEFLSPEKKKMSFVQTRDIAQRTMNCFFNRSIKAQVEQGVTRYRQKGKESLPDVNPPSDTDTGCAVVNGHPIASTFLSELDQTLSAVPKNREKIGEKRKPNKKQADIKTCNFELFDRDSKLRFVSDKNLDYFEERRKETISPTYAAYVTGQCYKLFYGQYLNLYFANSDEVAFGIPIGPDDQESSSPARHIDTWLDPKNGRRAMYEQERRKTDQAFEHAVRSIDTFTKTYPLHLQYSSIIVHSQEIRDQVRRFRVAMHQLVDKLRNQTTKNY